MSTVQDPKQKIETVLAIKEYSNALMQADSHKEHAKAIIADLAEKFELDKSELQKVANWFHKQNINDQREKAEGAYDLYDSLFPS